MTLLSRLVAEAQYATRRNFTKNLSLDSLQKQAEADVIAAHGEDVDVESYLSGKWRAADEDRRKVAAGFLARAGEYSKDQVSTPTLPRFAIDYDQSDLFAADVLCPVVPGSIERKFPKWSRRDATRGLNVQIGSDGVIPEAGLTITFDTYAEKPYGVKTRIDNNAVAQASTALDLIAHHGRAIMSDLMMQRERRVMSLLTTSGNYVAANVLDLSGNNRWDVGPGTSTADPLKNILITLATAPSLAKRFNTMGATPEVLQYLRQHPKVIAAAGYTASARQVAFRELEDILGLRIVSLGARLDTTGAASTASYSYVWPKSVVLAYIQPGLSMNELSFAKTFRHTPLSFQEEPERMRGVRGVTWMWGTHEDSEKIVANDCASLITNVIS